MMRLIKSLAAHSNSYLFSTLKPGSSIKLFSAKKRQKDEPNNQHATAFKESTSEPDSKSPNPQPSNESFQKPGSPIKLFSAKKRQTDEPNNQHATAFKESTSEPDSKNPNPQSSNESFHRSFKF